ncbi:NUDIX domain-containing protein [Candidatus Dojkabacteria bacterium]|nr:NUDIX domain-containing protein [Candidatus Dojkabacteria bacterium]
MDIKRPKNKQPLPPHAERVFEGKIFDIHQWEQEMFDGSKVIFEKAKRKVDSVNVLPVTNEGRIVLNKQEQPGEMPFIGGLGGRMDPGETPLETAKRELMEEGGITAENWKLLFAVHPDIKVDWVVYTFIAKDLDRSGWKSLDAGEKNELIEVTLDEFMDIVLEDNYRDTEIALYLLKASRDPQKWEEIKSIFDTAK